ncbi:MAG TPA: hypothetical protein VK084_06350 [Chitinophagaceae bacterium]|nr:hypothetical protein [Chitinophagaceae bacterium]
MPKLHKDPVFILIKSLSKAEKRQFRLDYTPKKKKTLPLFVQLFNKLDKITQYDENKLLSQIPKLKRQQLSNQKAHLYNHILETLRRLDRKKDIRIHIRQLIDYAQILYNKGLYQQSLKLLEKAKSLAKTHQEIELKMQVLELEKVIEARHITRSIENRAEQLSEESKDCIHQLSSLSRLSNLALNMYGMYLKMGHIRNEKEALMLHSFFKNNLPEEVNPRLGTASIAIQSMTFYEKVNLYQAHSWYAYILQDFILFYRYTQKWVDLFEKYPSQKETDPALYLKAINNLLTAHFFNQNYDKFKTTLASLETFWKSHYKKFNKNTKVLAFVHTYTAKINQHFLEGTFQEGTIFIPELLEELEKYRMQMDQHRILVFYYKIACLYFGSGDNHNAIQFLNKIINLKIGNLRADIQCFARILHLIAHYELKNYDVTEYLLPSVYHFLEKNKDLSAVVEEMLTFLKKFNHVGIRGLRAAFIDLKDRLEEVAENPYERRFFLYLDVISWLESKINRRPVQDVIREKFLRKEPRI